MEFFIKNVLVSADGKLYHFRPLKFTSLSDTKRYAWNFRYFESVKMHFAPDFVGIEINLITINIVYKCNT